MFTFLVAKRVQEIREDGRVPDIEDLKKMIRAKEKNGPATDFVLDSAVKEV